MRYGLALLLLLAACQREDARHYELARQLTQRFIVIDGHIDVPYRLYRLPEDVTQRTELGDFDYERARAGGLDAPFFSIYLPSELQTTPGASKALADSLINMVEALARQAPDKFMLARSPEDVRRAHQEERIALLMGMENGSGLEGDLSNVAYFYSRGIRYITLTHARANQICDSSYDTVRVWNGLSPFGEQVVDEMNRLGMLIDISHVSDSAFYDVLRRTKAPVIASHSSARHFTPGWERNMSDDMIRALAANGGVIMINFGSSFLRSSYQAAGDSIRQLLQEELLAQGLLPESPQARRWLAQQRKRYPLGTVADVADHIDHVVRLVGVDHVGIGSDFDGVFALPEGLQDVSMYTHLVAELLRRGYSEADIEKILGGNLLRVWEAVEAVATRLQQQTP
jgi:membrane dipeptidase